MSDYQSEIRESEISTSKEMHSTYFGSGGIYQNLTPPKKRGFPRWILILIIIFSAICTIGLVAKLSENADEELTPVAEPQSGAILLGREDVYGSTITVTAPRGKACVVRLKTKDNVTRLSFYVRAGDTVIVGVPQESLYAYFALGSVWYGGTNLFGENTTYSMDDEACDYSRYSMTYSLNSTSSGNFSTTPISEKDFK